MASTVLVRFPRCFRDIGSEYSIAENDRFLSKYYKIAKEKVEYSCPQNCDRDDAFQFVCIHIVRLFPKRHKWNYHELDNIIRSVIKRKIIDHIKKFNNNIVTNNFGDSIITSEGLLCYQPKIFDDDNKYSKQFTEIRQYIHDNIGLFTQQEIDLFELMILLAKLNKPLTNKTLITGLGYNYMSEEQKKKGNKVIESLSSKVTEKFHNIRANEEFKAEN